MRRHTLTGQIALGLALGLGAVAAIDAGLGDDDCGWGLHVETQTDGGIHISSGTCRFEADLRGELEVDEAETRLLRLGDGARVLIDDRSGDHRRRFVATPGPAGSPTVDYQMDGKAAPFDADAEAWLAVALPRALRETGAGLEARVGRLWRRGGLDDVLDEARRIGPDSGARAFLAAVRSRGLDADGEAAVLRAAARSIGSDEELAAFLAELDPAVFEHPEAADALVSAASSIGSDQALYGALSALLERGAGPGAIEAIVRSAESIGSDSALADLVLRLAEAAEGPLPRELADLLPAIGSDEALRRALLALLDRPQLGTEAPDAWLDVAPAIGADGPLSDVLLVAAERWPADSPLPRAFFTAADLVGSDADLGRALRSVVEHRRLSDEEIAGLLRAATSLGSDAEQAALLAALVDRYPEAADRDDFEEALAGVGARSERERVVEAIQGR